MHCNQEGLYDPNCMAFFSQKLLGLVALILQSVEKIMGFLQIHCILQQGFSSLWVRKSTVSFTHGFGEEECDEHMQGQSSELGS